MLHPFLGRFIPVSTPPLMQTTGGVLCFPETACDIFFVNLGELTCSKSEKTDTPLASMFSLAGCSFFHQSSAVQLQQVTIGKNLTFDLYDQGVSAGNPRPLFGDSSEKLISKNC